MIAKTLRAALLAATASILALAADASAQSFQVTASVRENCVIAATSDIAISTPASPWDPTGGPIGGAIGTIGVRCTRGTNYTIDVNGGVYTDAMTHTNGTDTLPYRFFASDCATAFTPIAFTATSRAQRDHQLCANIDYADPLLDPIAGDYSDTVLVDVTF